MSDRHGCELELNNDPIGDHLDSSKNPYNFKRMR